MACSKPSSGGLDDFGAKCSISGDKPNIGANQWRKPVFEVGPGELKLENLLLQNRYVGKVNFTKDEWSKARQAVDEVLDLMLNYIKEEAKKHKGLVIQKYIRKGSSRDGIKAREPDEFDVLLQFYIEGLSFEHRFQQRGKSQVIEFGEIRVLNTVEDLTKRFPSFQKLGAFVEKKDNTILLSSEVLHEKVFKSLIDKAITAYGKGASNHKITRKINPPSVNITIHLEGGGGSSKRLIDVDIVPGMLVVTDQLPFPGSTLQQVPCPSHFIFRWRTKEQNDISDKQFDNPGELWRFSTTGFEAYMFDIAQTNSNGRYIMTAMRILKTYLCKTKELYQAESKSPPPVTTVLVSYHLKIIVLYCITFLKDISVASVKDAIAYIVDLLEVSLEEKKLPHFYRRNELLRGTFPSFTYDKPYDMAFDVFGERSSDARGQALLSLKRDMRVHLAEFIAPSEKCRTVKEKFRGFIRNRKYF